MQNMATQIKLLFDALSNQLEDAAALAKRTDYHSAIWRLKEFNNQATDLVNEVIAEMEVRLFIEQNQVGHLLGMKISNLKLSKRTLNALNAVNINTIADLLQYDLKEIVKMAKIGLKAVHEIQNALIANKLTWALLKKVRVEGVEFEVKDKVEGNVINLRTAVVCLSLSKTFFIVEKQKNICPSTTCPESSGSSG